MSDPINGPAMQPDPSEELFVVELDDRLEFGVAAFDDVAPVEAAGNAGCTNTSWCSGTNPGCSNGSNCS
ncbi:MAG TPA: hypothetical protein VIX89_03630 [Bryobacteraceae bacterium]